MDSTEDGFAKREKLVGYWDDPRWEDVKRLRSEGNHAEANHLVFVIRGDWGLK